METYTFGDIVYLRTDPDQFPRIVTGIMVKENYVAYELSFVDVKSWHNTVEISSERDIVKATSN